MTTTLAWIAEHTPPAPAVARIAQNVAGRHDRWDVLHGFTMYYLDGADLRPVAHIALDTTIPPASHPNLLAGMVREHVRKAERGAAPIVACLYEMEMLYLSEAVYAELTEDQRAVVEQGGMHTIPGVRERCLVTAADIAGRVWTAHKARNSDKPVRLHTPAERGTPSPFEEMMRATLALIPPLYVAAGQSFWKGRG